MSLAGERHGAVRVRWARRAGAEPLRWPHRGPCWEHIIHQNTTFRPLPLPKTYTFLKVRIENCTLSEFGPDP